MGSKNNYYINFRDSKLTRILQNSLCGKSQTAVICCISQLPTNMQESLQALYFGSKAKSIRTQVDINEIVRESPDRIANKMAKMSKDIQMLERKLVKKEEQILKFQTEAKNLSNIGPLKSHMEHLEFLLNEKQEQLVTLQLECDELK